MTTGVCYGSTFKYRRYYRRELIYVFIIILLLVIPDPIFHLVGIKQEYTDNTLIKYKRFFNNKWMVISDPKEIFGNGGGLVELFDDLYNSTGWKVMTRDEIEKMTGIEITYMSYLYIFVLLVLPIILMFLIGQEIRRKDERYFRRCNCCKVWYCSDTWKNEYWDEVEQKYKWEHWICGICVSDVVGLR